MDIASLLPCKIQLNHLSDRKLFTKNIPMPITTTHGRPTLFAGCPFKNYIISTNLSLAVMQINNERVPVAKKGVLNHCPGGQKICLGY